MYRGKALADTYVHNCNKLSARRTGQDHLQFSLLFLCFVPCFCPHLSKKLWDNCSCLTSSLPSFCFLQFRIDSSNTPKKICAKLIRETPVSSGSRSCWLARRCQQSCSATWSGAGSGHVPRWLDWTARPPYPTTAALGKRADR